MQDFRKIKSGCFIFLFIFTIPLSVFSQSQQQGSKAILNEIERIRMPVSRSQTTFVIKEKDLHPESIAYNEREVSLFLASCQTEIEDKEQKIRWMKNIFECQDIIE